MDGFGVPSHQQLHHIHTLATLAHSFDFRTTSTNNNTNKVADSKNPERLFAHLKNTAVRSKEGLVLKGGKKEAESSFAEGETQCDELI